MNLLYRKYRSGDGLGITTLYNRAFAHSLYPKTERDTLWKFVEKPEFNPDFLNICEDTENHNIVGFIASEVFSVLSGDRIIQMGFINEVGTDPDYQKLGIAKKLMMMAMDEFKSEGTELSCLVADPNGHPRSKLYIPAGYKDFCYSCACFHITSIPRLIWDIPLSILISPFLILGKGIIRLVQKIREHLDISAYQIEIKDGVAYPEFYDAANRLMPLNYDLFPLRSTEHWVWLREKVGHPGEKPLYITVVKNNQIIAGVSITDRVANLHFLHFKTRLGTIGEYFVDKSQFPTEKTLQMFMDWFNGIVLSTAGRRKITALLAFPSDQDRFVIESLSRWGVISMKAGVYMLRQDSRCIIDAPFIRNEKPVYISTYDSMGIP